MKKTKYPIDKIKF